MSTLSSFILATMHIKVIIQNLGLSKTETNIYLSSLELGESTISDISNAVNLPRSSCYEAIKHLVSLGLINTVKIGARKVYVATNPERLLTILKEREAALKEIMPQLKSKHHTRNKKPSLYFYEGQEEIKAILDDILDRQFPLYAITSVDDMLIIAGDDFRDFIEKRHKKHLRVNLLTKKTKTSMELKERDSIELRQTKFLPNSYSLTTANFIYGDRMAIISTKAKTPFGLIIEDEDIAQTYRDLFEIVWGYNI